MSKTGIIRIKNAIFYGYHGVHTSEQNSGGRFEVDVDLYCDISDAMQTDSLKSTVDYEQVYNFLKDLITEKWIKNFINYFGRYSGSRIFY